MIKDSLDALGASARETFRNWRVLLLLGALYAALLACVYYFFATGVANAWQLLITAVTAAAAPLLFLLLQAAAANAAVPGATASSVARGAARDLPKVLALALPVLALAALFVYLLGQLEGRVPKADEAPHAYVSASVEPRPVPLRWQGTLLSTLWLLLLGVVVPLAAAHLWLSAARIGLGATLKGLHRVMGRALLPRPVLVYMLGFLAFGLMPYFIVYTRTAVANGWAELALFGLRLALAFAFTLLGWAITLGALARVTPPVAETPAAADIAAPPPEPAAVEPQLQA